MALARALGAEWEHTIPLLVALALAHVPIVLRVPATPGGTNVNQLVYEMRGGNVWPNSGAEHVCSLSSGNVCGAGGVVGFQLPAVPSKHVPAASGTVKHFVLYVY